MFILKVWDSGRLLKKISFDSVVSAKSEMWRSIAAKIELGEIDDRHIVYGSDSLHVSCDGWSRSVDAA